MSSSIGLGVSKLLPITATFAAPFTGYFIILVSRVLLQRLSSEHFWGDKLSLPPAANPSSKTSKPPHDPLLARARAHANFAENVPLAFILLITCELNGGDPKILTAVMSTLLALRIAHAEFGLMLEGQFGDCGIGRPLGFLGTLGVLGYLAGYAAYLGGVWRL